MAIEDVIRDLHIYFKLTPVEITAQMGGHVNPSYLTVKHGIRQTVFPFWSVQGGSEKEKQLARAFRDDIEDWINQRDLNGENTSGYPVIGADTHDSGNQGAGVDHEPAQGAAFSQGSG